MDEKTILVIGEWSHIHLAAPLGWLDVNAACIYYRKAGPAVAHLQSPARHVDPCGILLLQSRPGQFSSRDAERLHAAAPLARLVELAGPWCEGEQRSGQVLPGVVRVPWRAWQYRLAAEFGLAKSAARDEPTPRTATQVERIEREIRAFMREQSIAARAIVYSNNRINYECIAAALARLGLESAWHHDADRPSEGFDIEIYDGWQRGRESLTEHGPLPCTDEARQRPATPSIMLMHFPRPQDVDRAQDAGFSAVVAQPLLLRDLATAIEVALRRASSGQVTC